MDEFWKLNGLSFRGDKQPAGLGYNSPRKARRSLESTKDTTHLNLSKMDSNITH